jgi:DinB superfamily
MGMFADATGSIRRLPKFLGLIPARNVRIRISAAQLEGLVHQVENITLKARNLVSGRSQSELATSLEASSWSVVECLDHLTQTTNAFIPAISSAMPLAPRLTRKRALRMGTLTRLFIRNLEPPYRLRFKVPTRLMPRRRDSDSAWEAFEQSQAQLVKTIASAAGLAIDQVRVESPVYARFSYNVYGALCMLAAHERRHLWQMEQTLNDLDLARVRDVPVHQ